MGLLFGLAAWLGFARWIAVVLAEGLGIGLSLAYREREAGAGRQVARIEEIENEAVQPLDRISGDRWIVVSFVPDVASVPDQTVPNAMRRADEARGSLRESHES
jgi:hypothetical protein